MRYATILIPALLLLLSACTASSHRGDWDNDPYQGTVGTDGML